MTWKMNFFYSFNLVFGKKNLRKTLLTNVSSEAKFKLRLAAQDVILSLKSAVFPSVDMITFAFQAF